MRSQAYDGDCNTSNSEVHHDPFILFIFYSFTKSLLLFKALHELLRIKQIKK